MNIHQKMDEQIGLAKTYAEDGAFFSAAAVLEQLVATLRAHATRTSPFPAAQPDALERTAKRRSPRGLGGVKP